MNVCLNDIDLWMCYDEKISDIKLLEQYYSLMSLEECLKHQRFHLSKHRHQYLVTRALVRSVLSKYAPHIPANEWRFKTNKYGKPEICNHSLKQPLFFNISHSEKLIIMAVTQNENIGVDVEYLKNIKNISDIAKRYFAPKELKDLLNQNMEIQKQYFYDLWTLKESYIKAKGLGLSIPLNQFYFTFSNQNKIKINFSPSIQDDANIWKFWQVAADQFHKIAIAVMNQHTNVECILSFYQVVPLSLSAPTKPKIVKTT